MIRIKRKNVMKQNNYWKICKKKYQKLHFEHDYLKKKKKKKKKRFGNNIIGQEKQN